MSGPKTPPWLPPEGVVTTADLESFATEAVGAARRLRADPEDEGDHWLETRIAAAHVMVRILGTAWAARHLDPRGDASDYFNVRSRPGDSGGEPFDRALGDEATLVWARTVHVAQLLYDLQGVENIADRLRRLEGTLLDGTVAELDVVWMLRESKTPCLVRPEAGGGHDADLVLDDSVFAAVEIKCKAEGERPTENNILGPLKHARQVQLPRDRPTMVWVSVPPTWTDPDGLAAIARITESCFRNTTSISVVAYHCRRLERHPALGAAKAISTRFWAHRNARARFQSEAFERVFERMARSAVVKRPFLHAEVERAIAMLSL